MVVKRLKQYLDSKEISISAFEKSIGSSNASFRKTLNNNGSIGTKKLEKILTVYTDLNTEWLLTGKGKMYKGYKLPAVDTIIANEPRELFGEYLPVPLIPVDKMTDLINGRIEVMGLGAKDRYVIPDFQTKGVKFLIRMSGTSMYPTYNNGDILACRPVEDLSFFQWGKVYVLDTEQGPLVKRLFPCPGDPELLECRSDDKGSYPPFCINRNSIIKVSIVAGVINLE